MQRYSLLCEALASVCTLLVSSHSVYLSWILKQPLLSGFVLISRHSFSHLKANCGAHGVQYSVQPHLHLTHTCTHEKTKPKNKVMNTNEEKHCFVYQVSTNRLSYQWTIMRSLISTTVDVESGKYYGM